jgi:hypothetical protein
MILISSICSYQVMERNTHTNYSFQENDVIENHKVCFIRRHHNVIVYQFQLILIYLSTSRSDQKQSEHPG